MSNDDNKILAFADFHLDIRERIFSRSGSRIKITDKAFDLLCVLVTRSGKLVSKDELLAEVWHDTIVEENTLDKNVSLLRRLLNEKEIGTKFIETVRGHGYRFIADVTLVEVERSGELNGKALELAPQSHSETNGNWAESQGTADVERVLPLAPRADVDTEVRQRRLGKGRWIFAALGIGAIGLLAFIIFREIRPSPSVSPGVKRLGVLPLLNKTEDPDSQYLADGITDGIIDDLSGVSGLKVTSRSSAFRFRTDQTNLSQIGQQLGVELIVSGAIKKVGDQFAVTVRLTDLGDDSQIWGNQYVKDASDILTVQNEITQDVVAELRLKLNATGQDLIARTYAGDPAAYRLFLLGRYHTRKATEDELVVAIGFYEKALTIDPKYAMALVGLADCYRTFAIAGWHMGSREAWERSRDAATKALAIDPNLATAHSDVAWTLYMYDRDWEGAEREFRLATTLAPDNADIHRGLAHMLSLAGRHEEAIAEGRYAVELDPLSLLTNALYGQFLFFGGHIQAAVEQVNKTFAIEPNFWIAHNLLGRILLSEGKYSEALDEFQRARDFSGGGSIVPITEIGYTYAKMGRTKAALGVIHDLEKPIGRRSVPFYSFAMIYNGLGERDTALKYLVRSISVRETDPLFIKCNRRWDSYKGDPRFDTLMKQMHFDQ